MRISKNIKYYRELKGLTQEDMVGLGFNYRHYQRLESGRHAMNTRTLAKVSLAFQIDPVELLKVRK